MAAALRTAPPAPDPATLRARQAAREQADREAARAAARKKGGNTVKFNFDTTDFRTKLPERGVNKRRRGILNKSERANFGDTPEGMNFARRIHQLRLRARDYRDRLLESDGQDFSALRTDLLAEADRLSKGFAPILPPSIARAALAAISEVREVVKLKVGQSSHEPQKPTTYVPVPAELTTGRFSPTVSGGLPTMGRRRR